MRKERANWDDDERSIRKWRIENIIYARNKKYCNHFTFVEPPCPTWVCPSLPSRTSAF